MLYTAYVVALGFITLAALIGARFAWRQRQTAGALSLSGFLLTVAFWSLCDLLAALSPDAQMAFLFESRLRFISVAASPVFMLLLALEYTGKTRWFQATRIALLFVIPAITQLVIWFGPPDSFISAATYQNINGFFFLQSRITGPWFMVHAIYGYTVIGIGLTILLNKVIHTRHPYRQQAALLFAGLLVLAAISIARTVGSGPLLIFDWIALAVSITGGLWIVALFRYSLLDLAPIARESLIENMPDLVLIIDRQERLLDFNPAAHQTLRWERQTAIGQPIRKLLAGWPVSTESTTTGHYELNRGSRCYDLLLTPLGQHEHEPVGQMGILRDITQQKELEKTSQRNESTIREFQQKLIALHKATMILAQQRDLPDLYETAVQIGRDQLGFERIAVFMIDNLNPESMVGTFGTDAHGNLRDERGFRQAIATNPKLRDTLQTKARYAVWRDTVLHDNLQEVGRGWNAMALLWDGTEGIGWLVVDNLLTGAPLNPYCLELLALFGQTLGYLITTLRHRLALQESQSRFRRLTDATFEGVVIHDNGLILDANPAFGKLLGYSLEELRQKNIIDLVSAESYDVLLSKMNNEAESIYELTGRHKDGSTFPAEIHVRIIPYQGRVCRVAAVRDISQRKDHEQQQLELSLERQRVDILAKFITKASHEFRTPLSIINNSAYLLSHVADPDRRAHYLQTVTTQVKSLTHLVDALTNMAHLDSTTHLRLIPADVNHLMRTLQARLHPQLQRKNHTLIMDCTDNLPAVHANPQRLLDALTNLMENAVRYTPAGGTISLRTDHTPTHVCISISDNGVGISPDQLDHIFERFYRVDEAHTTRGFGLGLPIAQRIIDLHGGTITAESTVNEGSQFVVSLPIATVEEETPPPTG
jgi:PAS domain S-box-containing protein